LWKYQRANNKQIMTLLKDLSTDYRYECVSKKLRLGTGQYFKWMAIILNG
jgi:hypothetical protein